MTHTLAVRVVLEIETTPAGATVVRRAARPDVPVTPDPLTPDSALIKPSGEFMEGRVDLT